MKAQTEATERQGTVGRGDSSLLLRALLGIACIIFTWLAGLALVVLAERSNVSLSSPKGQYAPSATSTNLPALINSDANQVHSTKSEEQTR